MVYIGVDIEEVTRFEKLISQKSKLAAKLFSPLEWAYGSSKKNAQTLTGIWCAKEAVVKAFSAITVLDIRNVHIAHYANGAPFVSQIVSFDFNASYQIALSISHTKHYATATCLVYPIKGIAEGVNI